MATRPRIRHELKEWPQFFKFTRNGQKKFQLRRNDRDYQVGDELLLKEWQLEVLYHKNLPAPAVKEHYTGREVLVRVDYIMGEADMTWFCGSEDYIIMSVSLV